MVEVDLGGHVHCGKKQHRPSLENINRILCEDFPDWVDISVVHNRVFTAWLAHDLPKHGISGVDGITASALFWSVMLAKPLSVTRFISKHSKSGSPKNHLDGLTINSRVDKGAKGSSEDLIRDILSEKCEGAPLAFTHDKLPGLGLADLYAWATRSLLVPSHKLPTGYSKDRIWANVPVERIHWHFPPWKEAHRGFYCEFPAQVSQVADLIEHQYRSVNGLIMPSDLLRRIDIYRKSSRR